MLTNYQNQKILNNYHHSNIENRFSAVKLKNLRQVKIKMVDFNLSQNFLIKTFLLCFLVLEKC